MRSICLKCATGKGNCGLSGGGVSFISFDAAENEKCRDKIASRRALRFIPEIVESPLHPKERENLLKILFLFGSLSYDEAGLVVRMMQGKTLNEIASERKQSLQTIHARWKALIERESVWIEIANGMIGSGRGRKPTEKPKERDLFSQEV